MRLFKTQLFLLFAVVFANHSANAQEIVAQAEIGKDGCGPCAIYNCIKLSNLREKLAKVSGDEPLDKVRSIIDMVGEKPSVTYDYRLRYAEGSFGMSPEDVAASFNDVLDHIEAARNLTGTYLDRRDDEYLMGHLHRMHGLFKDSLDQGQPVLTSFRSFVARKKEGKEKPLWYGLGNHFVAVTKVQDELRPNEKGFSFEFMDSESGKKEFGYLYFDQARNFTAKRGNAQHFEWKRNRPFLCAVIPSLSLKTNETEFFQRTFICASFAVFPEQIYNAYEKRLFSTKVEVACGQCQFGIEGEGCKLAIRHGDKSWYVEGTDIDAHAEDGFCNTTRHALVTGSWNDKKFMVEKFKLQPVTEK